MIDYAALRGLGVIIHNQPLGVGTAIWLEEYAPNNRLTRIIEINIANLAGVPSVVYGILGLAWIVRGPLSLGRILLAGALCLSLLVLPVVIVVSREAIRAVPPSIREGSLALGATQSRLSRGIITHGLRLVFVGAIAGLIGAAYG